MADYLKRCFSSYLGTGLFSSLGHTTTFTFKEPLKALYDT